MSRTLRYLSILALLLSSVVGERVSANEAIFFAANADYTGGCTYSIYRVNPDGTEMLRLSSSPCPPANEFVPAVSPDGQWVAFQAQYAGLWKMRVDGSDRTLVTANGGGVATTEWSPDGSLILYNNVSTCSEDIYAVRPDGSDDQLFINAGVDFQENVGFDVSWPTSDRLAVLGIDCGSSRTLYVKDPNGGRFQPVPFPGYHLNDMDLSPDGSRFVLSIETTTAEGQFSNIYTARVDGGGLRQLTFNSTPYRYDVFPSWSPDGRQIVFCHQIPYDHALWVMNADGTNRHQITPNQNMVLYHPVWARIAGVFPPVALCQNVHVPAGDACQATITPSDLDAGSYDPDGGSVTLSVDNAGPFSLGDHTVTLTVTDEDGETASCEATVSVADSTAPTVTLTDPVCVSHGNGNGNNANKLTARGEDGCGPVTLAIDSVQVFNGGGQPVNGNGVYEVVGNDVFTNPNGNGWSVVVTISAVDESGNRATSTITKPLLKCR